MTNLTNNSFILWYVYYSPLQVSSNVLLIIRRSYCINAGSGIFTRKTSEWSKITKIQLQQIVF